MTGNRLLPIFLFSIVIIAIQLITHFTETGYYLTQLTMSAYYSLAIISLCLLMGYAGQISLGHAGFFAIGGYLSAALNTLNLNPYLDNPIIAMISGTRLLVSGQDMFGSPTLLFHPWLSAAIAIFTAIIIAFFLGIPVLKLKGHYLAMATLGFGIIIYRIVLAMSFFGEADGISDVPGFPVIGSLSVSGEFDARIENYYMAWGLLFFGLILLLNLIKSRVGRALRSIHSSEEAANAMGVNTSGYKLYTFVITAVFAAIAGIFLTHYNGGIGPSEASIMKSVRYVAIVAIGGMANLWGALIMGIILNFLSLRGLFGSYDDAVFGCILVLIMLFAPNGIIRFDLLKNLAFWKKGE
jgi:branched-chain amino acid transport system permease protein